MKMIDEDGVVDSVNKDFIKAFGNVPHGTLMQKITIHGIHGDLVNEDQNWFSHRRQRVIVEECFSDWRRGTNGVLQ